MPIQSWEQLLITAQTNGTAVANSASEATLLPTQARYVLPANFLTYVGQQLKIRAAGRISNIVTTPGTLTLRVKIGSAIVGTSPAFPLNTTAKTDVTWVLDWTFTVRSVGSGTAATLMHTGQWQSEAYVGSPAASAGSAGTGMIPTSAPAVGAGFDSTAAAVVDLTGQFSVANAGNSIQLHQYELESKN